MVKLEVLICTTAARLSQLAPGRLPMLPEVRYIVVCQNPDGANTVPARAALARRHDIEVCQFDDRGLSVNRNHALDLATAPYMHIADDDLRFKAEGLRQIIAEFDADPSLDVLCTHAEIPEEHIYPPDGWNLAEPYRFYSPVSFEISLRRRAVENIGLRFSPLFGIGAPFLAAGEGTYSCTRRSGAASRAVSVTYAPWCIPVRQPAHATAPAPESYVHAAP